MTYSERKNTNNNDRVQDLILYVLDLRMQKYENKDVKSKGHGLHLIQKVINNNRNRNKYNWDEISEAVTDLYKNSYISYHSFHFYFITDKGKRILEINKDKKGKALSKLIRKIF